MFGNQTPETKINKCVSSACVFHLQTEFCMGELTEDEKEEFKEFLKDQKHEMEIHKWIESEKVGHDLGNEAIKDWIDKYADEFRQNWNREHGQSK